MRNRTYGQIFELPQKMVVWIAYVGHFLQAHWGTYRQWWPPIEWNANSCNCFQPIVLLIKWDCKLNGNRCKFWLIDVSIMPFPPRHYNCLHVRPYDLNAHKTSLYEIIDETKRNQINYKKLTITKKKIKLHQIIVIRVGNFCFSHWILASVKGIIDNTCVLMVEFVAFF